MHKANNGPTCNVTIRIDESLRDEAENLFGDFGLTLSAAVTMFLKQAVREQRIPFDIWRTAEPENRGAEE